MTIPRFRDADGDYEIVLFCPKCAWAITKGKITQGWTKCRLCDAKLETRRVDYQPNTYGYRQR